MWKRRLFLSVAAMAAMGAFQGSVSAANAAEKDIVTTALEAGSFKTLAAALKAGGLVGTLQGKGPFTVFAPTDEAFAKLPPGTVDTFRRHHSFRAATPGRERYRLAGVRLGGVIRAGAVWRVRPDKSRSSRKMDGALTLADMTWGCVLCGTISVVTRFVDGWLTK